MKPNNRRNQLLALLAAASCVGSALAGDLPVSRTEAAVRLTAAPGVFTALALPLYDVVATGTLTATSPLTVTPAIPADLTTQPHAIMITSRVNQSEAGAYGKSKTITANTTTTVTAAGLTPSVGDKFVIVKLFTLASVFDGASPATYGFASDELAGDSDTFFVESNGLFTPYWYKSGDGWKTVADGEGTGPDVNPVINPGRGLLISRLPGGSAASWHMTGTSVSGRFVADTTDGLNLISIPFTLSTTLANSGIQNFVQGEELSGDADAIYVESGGIFSAYYYNTVSNIWSSVNDGGSPVDAGSTVLPAGKAVLYQKLPGGTKTFAMPEPFTN